MNYTVDQVLEELEDLGFYGIVTGYENGGASYDELAADLERARAETTEEELPDHVYRRASRLLSKLFGSERERHMMRMSELRQLVRKSILSESYDSEEPTGREIREWVIWELLSIGFHTEFLKYLLQFLDADKRVLNNHLGQMLSRMDRARDIDPIPEGEPKFGESNHPGTMMRMFVERLEPNEDEKYYISQAHEQIGDERLEDIIDRVHQHRVKYSKKTDQLGRPVYY